MMINPLHDAETVRQQKNLTESQRKNTLSTREGVLVNNCVKDKDCSLSETKDTFMIADNVPLPRGLYQDNKIVDKKLLPLSSIALGVMSSVALLTAFINRSAKASVGLAKEKWLPSVTRNVQLSKETYQVIYQMVQNPNRKTFIAGAGVLALSAMAFMGKTFFDGFKDVWVKRKESDIQKNLQENLVSVETESFSGKMQIIRSMLSKYSADFEKYIKYSKDKANAHCNLAAEYWELDDKKLASDMVIKHVESALKINPEIDETYVRMLVSAYRQNGDNEKAENTIKKYLKNFQITLDLMGSI